MGGEIEGKHSNLLNICLLYNLYFDTCIFGPFFKQRATFDATTGPHKNTRSFAHTHTNTYIFAKEI